MAASSQPPPLLAGLLAAGACSALAALAALALYAPAPPPRQLRARARAYLLQHQGAGADSPGSADEGAQVLRFLAEALGAQRCLSVGVRCPAAALQLARAVGPSGRVYALGAAPDAQAACQAAGVADWVLCVPGAAEPSLAALVAAGEEGAFDLVVVEAQGCSAGAGGAYDAALELLRVGGMLAVRGALLGCAGGAVDELNARVRGDARLAAVMVGAADDGLYLARRKAQ
jgi:predicted O-methyltransferase YrrM